MPGPSPSHEPQAGPNRAAAMDQYRRHASTYDEETDWAAPDRERVVELLDLRPGDVVIDVGCGTGLCFRHVVERVGPTGRLIGIEPSIDMLSRAEERRAGAGWRNVELCLGAAEDVRDLGVRGDAALLCFTHDVLRTPAALEAVIAQLRPGGRVAAVGPMWAPWWAPTVNLFIWYVASEYVTTFEGFAKPWDHLARLVPDLTVERHELLGKFFAWGKSREVRPRPRPGAIDSSVRISEYSEGGER